MMLAALVSAFIGFILIICYPINKRKNARCTEQTQGALEDILSRRNSKGRLKSWHVYSYSVDGIEYQLKTLDYSPQVRRVGDTCTIWYNPEKPKDAQAFRGSDKYLRILLLVGIALFLLGILLACIGFVRQYVM